MGLGVDGLDESHSRRRQEAVDSNAGPGIGLDLGYRSPLIQSRFRRTSDTALVVIEGNTHHVFLPVAGSAWCILRKLFAAPKHRLSGFSIFAGAAMCVVGYWLRETRCAQLWWHSPAQSFSVRASAAGVGTTRR